EGMAAQVRMKRLIGLDEGFLRDVLSHLRLPEQTSREIEDRPTVAFNKHFKSLPVASQTLLD
ncbi:MAG: hypothetical protein ABIK18_05375, partial [candidate division WOR-3 bacterium]